MVKPLRGRAGYTLTEAMLVVAIVGILGSVGSQMFLQVNRYFILANTRAELQREARSVMYVISRSLRQAQSSTIVLDRFNTSQPFYTRLTFTKIQGDTLRFYQSGQSLIQSEGSQTRTMTKNLKYLSFTFPRSDDMTIISVSLTLEKSIYQGRTKALHVASEKIQVMN